VPPPRLPPRSGAGGTMSTSRPSGRTGPSSPSPPPTPSSPPSHWYALLPSPPCLFGGRQDRAGHATAAPGRGDTARSQPAIRRLVPRLPQKPNLFCAPEAPSTVPIWTWELDWILSSAPSSVSWPPPADSARQDPAPGARVRMDHAESLPPHELPCQWG
jgi:hypothetical protein